MKKQIVIPIIGILTIGVIFLLSEIFGYTTITDIGQNEVIVEQDDSCGYYLNRAVDFTIDTLAGMKEYKIKKEEELSNCVEENIELVKQLERNGSLPNWRTKYNKIYERFEYVEKENMQLISENEELKNTIPVYTPFDTIVERHVWNYTDTIIYDDKNKTFINVELPYLINYYANGEHINPPGEVYVEVVYSTPKIKVQQEVSIVNVITEDENGLVAKSITQHPNVKINNEETIFDLSKRRLRQLVRKIDPDARVLDVK